MRAPGALAQPPLSRGAASYRGAGWWAGGRERGVSGRLSGALRASAVFFQLLELLRVRPSPPSSPHPAPSLWLGLTVIPLGAFTALTPGLEHKSLARRRSREASSTPSLEGGAGWGLAEA